MAIFALVACLLLTLLFVFSFQLNIPTHLINKSRNHPHMIKYRLFCVTIACFLSIIITITCILGLGKTDGSWVTNALDIVGLHPRNFFKSIVISAFTTLILFSGPLLVVIVYNEWPRLDFTWTTWRNVIHVSECN